jgi:hypothetical protein
MIIRQMVPRDEDQVRRLHVDRHPGWPPRPKFWYFTNPTLVVDQKGVVVGFTSFSVTTLPDGHTVAYGADLIVAEGNKGLGKRLHESRLKVCKSVGATTFFGLTRLDNVGMVKILVEFGSSPIGVVKDAFPYDRPPADGVLYAGPV